jgi:hypothetical protein
MDFAESGRHPMASDRTQPQSPDEWQRARHMSLERTQPPTEVPGCELQRFVGAGAYGEVWAGLDRNTGRKVAVKFYLHRGGVDWTLLSREVEKLVFLSADRYVVQLLDVGWDADPPYYVMEYIENGSLEDFLQHNGPMALDEATDMLREIATGLVHAHGKGVLHCDLKPANVLLDQDRKPRLADFGQSRLSHEQTQALGTLFFMAPEQADLEAVPDARWDVYALGAILHCMLTGQPPYRNEKSVEHIDTARNLPERLARYRQLIRSSSRSPLNVRIPGVDRPLAEILQRCLAVEPSQRFANVQEILGALRTRDDARARRPLVLLGIMGPILLLLVMALFGWRGYNRALKASEQAVIEEVARSNGFAARAVAETAAGELEQHFRSVERAAADPNFQQLLLQLLEDPDVSPLLEKLSDPAFSSGTPPERVQFIASSARLPLQQRIEQLFQNGGRQKAASWFVCDPRGTQLAAEFDSQDGTTETVGRNYGWRTYFHGGPADLVSYRLDGDRKIATYQPLGDRRLAETHLSAPFQSTATNLWKVAISTPIYQGDRFLGVVAMTVNLGVFVDFPFGEGERQFAVLVDGRPGNHTGMILQHPLFDELLQSQGQNSHQKTKLPEHFTSDAYRVALDKLDESATGEYYDPMGQDASGQMYSKPWVAAKAPVHLQRRGPQRSQDVDTGLVVLVQEDYRSALVPVRALGHRLVREGVWALLGVVCVVCILWYFVLRALGRSGRPRSRALSAPASTSEPTPLYERATLAATPKPRGARAD